MAEKIAELDRIIANLHQELDACPNARWASESNQYRLGLLILYVGKRAALAA